MNLIKRITDKLRRKPLLVKPVVSNRIILNVDSVGIHLRTNECTIHHGESGEVEYHCKPIRSIYGWFWKLLIKLVVKYGC